VRAHRLKRIHQLRELSRRGFPFILPNSNDNPLSSCHELIVA
jgi:hypothetical protein